MKRLLTGLKAAGEATRLRILAQLAAGELTVGEITELLGQSQPRVSRHLKLLAEAGLVERLQEGAWAFYRFADRGEGAKLARLLVGEIPKDDPVLLADLAGLDEVKAARQRRADRYFEANAAEWDRIRSLHVPEAEVEQALLGALDGGKIGDLIDIGTGTGRMLELFAPHAARGVGVDMSREMLALARGRLDRAGLGHCHVRRGDMYGLDFEDASFDVAILHQVLHFAGDPVAVLREAARVLRPGGEALIVDFAPHALEILRSEHAHRRLGFTDDEIIAAASTAGFAACAIGHLPGTQLRVTLWRGRKL